MGIDLTLCPRKYGINEGNGPCLLYDRITLSQDYRLWEEIEKVESYSVRKVDWYGDDGITEETTDPYGNKLRYVLARDLAKVTLSNDASLWNKAVFAMIRALNPEAAIVLWWH